MFLELKIHKSLTYLLLTGLHCTNTNESLDYCIEHNKWCVKFIDETTDGNVPYDLIEDFTIRFWLKYTSKMVRPCLFVTLSPNYVTHLLAERPPCGDPEVCTIGTGVPYLQPETGCQRMAG